MNYYEQWLELKEKQKAITEELHAIECEIWLAAEKRGDVNTFGGKSSIVGDYKITITHSESVKVDQRIAEQRPELFRLKYEFNKSEYKNMVKSQKEFIDEAITIVPTKPNFKIVRLENASKN